MARPMWMSPRLSALMFAALILLPASIDAQRRLRDLDAVYGGARAGQIKPLPEIENAVIPQMRGARYLGPEIRDDGRYRLKFMRGDQVIWVDVDPRTGAIIGRAGN